jgi:hypothetical protein
VASLLRAPFAGLALTLFGKGIIPIIVKHHHHHHHHNPMPGMTRVLRVRYQGGHAIFGVP